MKKNNITVTYSIWILLFLFYTVYLERELQQVDGSAMLYIAELALQKNQHFFACLLYVPLVLQGVCWWQQFAKTEGTLRKAVQGQNKKLQSWKNSMVLIGTFVLLLVGLLIQLCTGFSEGATFVNICLMLGCLIASALLYAFLRKYIPYWGVLCLGGALILLFALFFPEWLLQGGSLLSIGLGEGLARIADYAQRRRAELGILGMLFFLGGLMLLHSMACQIMLPMVLCSAGLFFIGNWIGVLGQLELLGKNWQLLIAGFGSLPMLKLSCEIGNWVFMTFQNHFLTQLVSYASLLLMEIVLLFVVLWLLKFVEHLRRPSNEK